MAQRKTTVRNTVENVEKFETYLSANGVTDYFTTEIENGRRVLFTYQRANVDGMGTEDAGVESGYFDDGGPTADDLGLTEGVDDE